MTEQTPKTPSWAELAASFRRTAEQIRAQLKTRADLIFEAATPGCEHVSTPTGPQHLLPTRGYDDDAGLDLYVSNDVEIGPHQFVDVPTGVRIDIPHGYWGFIVGRSSTLRKRGLLVNPGIIDAGWTGELFAGIQNMTGNTVDVAAGDRLAQLILLPASVVAYEPVWGKVPTKARGENGFGSTGA